MKNFLLSSLFIFFAGCSASYYGQFTPAEHRPLSASEVRAITMDSFSNVKYKADVDAYGYSLAGMLLIKKTPQNLYKIGFLSYTGLVIFSFELGDSSFTLISCLEQLNNPKAIRIIESDLRTLLFPRLPGGMVTLLAGAHTGEKVCRLESANGDVFYRIDDSTHALRGIDVVRDDKLTSEMKFHGTAVNAAAQVSIRHFDYPLAIQLEELGNE